MDKTTFSYTDKARSQVFVSCPICRRTGKLQSIYVNGSVITFCLHRGYLVSAGHATFTDYCVVDSKEVEHAG